MTQFFFYKIPIHFATNLFHISVPILNNTVYPHHKPSSDLLLGVSEN